MEILGAVSAAVTLATAVGSISTIVADFIHTVRLADSDAYYTQRELATLNHLLIQFHQLALFRESQGARLDDERGRRNPIIKQGKHLRREMKYVLRQIGMMDKDSLQTRWQRWCGKLRWYIKKKEVLELCVQFNQVKVSIMAFVCMAGLESVWEEIEELRNKLRQLSQERPTGFEERIARLKRTRRQLERRVYVLPLQST